MSTELIVQAVHFADMRSTFISAQVLSMVYPHCFTPTTARVIGDAVMNSNR